MKEDYYQAHWLEIEEDRLQRYDKMFQWRPEMEGLISPLQIEKGLTVVDYGCGPGYLSMELAHRVGSAGRVYGLDINREFVKRATARAKENNLHQLEFLLLEDDVWPLKSAAVDRVICKNVLEYVPDASQVMGEMYRVLGRGGRVEIIDSDWGFVIVEPWGKVKTEAYFEAASAAFKEPYIGRKLSALLGAVGFSDINLEVNSLVDREGRAKSVLTNMATYIKALDSMSESEVSSMMGLLDPAIEKGEYLFVLPQFKVTAVKKN